MRLPDRTPDNVPSGDGSGEKAESLGEALAWLDRHINLEAMEHGRAGRAALPTLERIAALTAAMGDPEKHFPLVHVTGTNGKGSTTRICSALVQANGLSVGTYTSPHLERLNERIAHNGEPISDDDLRDGLVALERLEGFVLDARPGMLPPTWFELMTATGYRYFADVAVDAAVVEVGLGGLYDATNVADADVAVLTNVELDHVQILGDTREKIAAEKSGVVKPGSIAVVGERDDDIVAVVAQQARRVEADGFWRRGVEFDCTRNEVAHGGRLLSLKTPGAEYEDVFVPLYGAHQGDNASIALAAAEAFFGSPLDQHIVLEALSKVRVPGRLEILGRRPLVVLDGAHNAAGAAALGAALEEDFAVIDRVILIFGCLNGRNPEELLRALDGGQVAHVVCCAPASLRALPVDQLLGAAHAAGIPASRAETVGDAFDAARALAQPDDMILVAGSLYLVGAAREYLSG